MVEIVSCSSCQKKLQIPAHYVGQKVQCPECGHMFIAASSSVSAEPMPPPPSSAPAPSDDRSPRRPAYEDDLDDPPIRRRSRFGDERDEDDDFDDSRRIRQHFTPHRGGLIMAMGLIALIGGWLFCLPVVVGPIAWIMAQMDLRAMREGHMDPAGESMVRTGQVCGIIATAVLVLAAAGGMGCLIFA